MLKKDTGARSPERIPPALGSEIRVPVPREKPLLRSRELLGTDGRLLIDHNGRWYELRSLPGGRLILTGWDERAVRSDIGYRSALR